MGSRIADTSKNSTANDFVIRKRYPTVFQFVGVYIIAFFALYAAGFLMNNYAYGEILYILVTGLVVGLLTGFTLFYIQRSRDLVLATEFQNALFASAAGLNTRFCIITKRDGSIVYFDTAFQTLFPDFIKKEQRLLDALLKSTGVKPDEANDIFAALTKDTFSHVVVSMKTADGRYSKMVLNIDPLPKPKGFYLLRAREYIEQRKEDTSAREAQIVREVVFQQPPLLQYLHSLDHGVYSTTAEGKLDFVNNTIETMLGYQTGEMLGRGMFLRDLIYQMSGSKSGDMTLEEYIGEVVLQKKNGGLIKAQVEQKPHMNNQGVPLGATGRILDAAVKKT